MNLIELSKYLNDEQAAENYLYEKGILKRFTKCPHCHSEKINNIRRNRIMCYNCRKEWHKRKNSFLEGKHIDCGTFIGILKLFSENIGVVESSFQLNLNIKTITAIYKVLSNSIFAYNNLESEIFSEPKFYLCQLDSLNIIAKRVSEFESIKDQTFGSFTMLRNRNIDLSYSFSYGFEWVHSNNRAFKNNINRFLSFTKHNLSLYRGISYDHFQQYFGILLIRYNSKEKKLFNIATESIKIS